MLDGPPAPVAPAVITRNAAGQATVRAIKLTSPLKVDGTLDDDVYTREQPFGGLQQVEELRTSKEIERLASVDSALDKSTIPKVGDMF